MGISDTDNEVLMQFTHDVFHVGITKCLSLQNPVKIIIWQSVYQKSEALSEKEIEQLF